MKHVIEEADISALKDLAEILGVNIDEEKQTLNCIWYT